MEELSNKLVITLLVLIVVSTIISTIAFLNMEDTVVVTPTGQQEAGGKATITFEGPPQEPVTGTGEAVIEFETN